MARSDGILIAVTDGLKGRPEALGAVFSATTLQTGIVHYADLRVMPTWRRPPLPVGLERVAATSSHSKYEMFATVTWSLVGRW